MLQFVGDADSTMDLAHRRAEAGGAAGDAIVAWRQGHGRGQHGREWSAEPGGLWLSVIGRPDGAAGLDTLSMRVALAIAELLERKLPDLPPITLKWPNDLLIAGRKLGGILTEARWQGERCLWVVTGVGINLHNEIPELLADKAVGTAALVPTPPAEVLAPAVATAVAAAMRGGPLSGPEQEAWWQRDALRGTWIDAPVVGVVEGVTETGALVVRNESGALVHCGVGVVARDN